MSEWSVDTLKEHLEGKLAALNERIDVQHRADQRALDLAQLNIDARLEKLNELRQQVSDDRATFANREATDERLKRIESFQNKLLGVALAVPVITSLVVYLLTKSG